MPREIPLFNAMVPALLLIFLGTLVLYLLLDRLLADWDLDRLVWHPALFRLAIFICVFSLLGIWCYS